jgi:hypothetical protein
LVADEVIGGLPDAADLNGAKGIEIAGSLESLDHVFGIEGEQGLSRPIGLPQVAADDGTADLAHLSDLFTSQKVNELRPLK